MPRQPWCRVIVLLLFALCAACGADEAIYAKTSDKTLAEILEDTEFAVTDHNLRIVGRLHIGSAIREQGKGQFPDYEIILYCSLGFAEQILALKPDLINTCPGRIAIRAAVTGHIISAPLWPDHTGNPELDRLMHDMNDMVKSIVDFAAEEWQESTEITNTP